MVDDGSSDATSEVLKKLAGPRPVCHSPRKRRSRRSPEHRDRRGTGQVDPLLDADDLWLPTKLEVQLAALGKCPLARFCFGGEIVRRPDGTEHTRECPLPPHSLFIHLLSGNWLTTSTAVIRRDCFGESGFFDTALRTGEDWDMWLRLAALFPSVLVPQPLVVYRRSIDCNKYPVALLERCTRRVLDRLFSDSRIAGLHPELAGLRRPVYAWHHSVLAKSYFRHRHYYRAGGRALTAIRSHSSGVRCLLPKATVPWKSAFSS